ncbi:MAG: aquaporin Z, partial [Gemmataceae bacterium]
MHLFRRFLAEVIGTFWLTFGGCGSAVLAAVYLTPDKTQLGIGFVGVSLAFGLTVLTMAYAIGHISGCHLNPAVTVGLVVARRHSVADLVPYVIAQVGGALLGALMLWAIISGTDTYAGLTHSSMQQPGAFATNGYGDLSPGKYSLYSCFLAELVLTFMFLFIILGATDKRAPAGFAPIAIGLGLTLIHLIGIPITNLSVNPARSTGPAGMLAILGEMGKVNQLWLFWAAPLAGAVLAGVVYPVIAG